MDKNVPTILKSLLASATLLNQPYNILANSTLNQKLNIQQSLSTSLQAGQVPAMQYVMIGIGGLSVATGPDSLTYTQSYIHTPTDTGLFLELPFVVVAVGSDISSDDRANYRLRKVININDVAYYAYYGKILNLSEITTSLQSRSVAEDGSITVADYTPTTDDLSPTATVLSSGQTVTVTGNYIAATTPISFTLDSTDITNLLNAAEVIYGNSDLAVISEIALCSGVDVSVTGPGDSGPVTYTEAIAMQVMSFLSTNFPAPSFSEGNTWTFDVGSSLPLLSVS